MYISVSKALLNICYPLSRVYVGKRVSEPVGAAMKYIFFWATLLAWKLYFSYQYEVRYGKKERNSVVNKLVWADGSTPSIVQIQIRQAISRQKVSFDVSCMLLYFILVIFRL